MLSFPHALHGPQPFDNKGKKKKSHDLADDYYTSILMPIYFA
jgi:hypothetical protein